MCQKKQKTYVKALNMIRNKNESKAMAEHISCDCKCKFNSTTCNGIIKSVKVNVKIIGSAEKIIAGILGHVFVRIVSS